jgi:hypothetical protein
VRIPECLLDHVQIFWVSQTFHCQDVVPIGLNSEHQARADGQTIIKNGASPTYPVLTSNVSTGQAQFVAQEIAQQQPRIDFSLVLGIIDGNG